MLRKKPIKRKVVKRKNPTNKEDLAFGINYEHQLSFSRLIPASMTDKQLIKYMIKELRSGEIDELVRINSDLVVHYVIPA